MGRRILNRKDLRADFDAAERRKGDGEEAEETEEEKDEDEAEEDEEEEEGEGEGEEEASSGGDDEEEDEGGDDDDEDGPRKKKKKVKAKPKPKAKVTKPRTRTAKVVRKKLVWGVFNNSNARIATYDYPKRKEADEHAARLTTDKKQTHFVQPIKEPIEEKKEKE